MIFVPTCVVDDVSKTRVEVTDSPEPGVTEGGEKPNVVPPGRPDRVQKVKALALASVFGQTLPSWGTSLVTSFFTMA